MKLVVMILNKTEALESLLENMTDAGITGATIIDSTGMARVIGEYDSMIMWSLRKMLNPERQHNKTIFTVVPDEQVATVSEIMKKSVGDLNAPDTGILFTVPIDHVEGLSKA